MTVPLRRTSTASASTRATARSWVTRRQPNRLSACSSSKQVDDLGLNRHIQGRGRLVADQQLRIGGQCSREDDALQLSPTEGRGPVLCGRVRCRHGLGVLHSRIALALGILSAQRLCDARSDTCVSVQGICGMLKHHLNRGDLARLEIRWTFIDDGDPGDGRSSPTISRVSVDLPAPLSPTTASVGSLDAEGDVSSDLTDPALDW